MKSVPPIRIFFFPSGHKKVGDTIRFGEGEGRPLPDGRRLRENTTYEVVEVSRRGEVCDEISIMEKYPYD